MPVDNGPLQDAKEILELKPTLTEDEQVVAEKIRPQLRAILRSEVRMELEADYIKREKEFQDTLTKASQEAVKNAIQQWKEEQEPLSQKDISTLLSQEYIEFTFAIKLRGGKEMSFVLVELPQEIEAKFLQILKKRFVPLLKTLVAAEFKLDLNSSAVEKLESLVGSMPEVLDVLCEMVAICLDPWQEAQPKINENWVKKHFSTHRILAVIIGQFEVNRYRDFFLNGFRLSKSLR